MCVHRTIRFLQTESEYDLFDVKWHCISTQSGDLLVPAAKYEHRM